MKPTARPEPLTERPEYREKNRRQEKYIKVRPAILADPGNLRGVSVFITGRMAVLTEPAARALADRLHDVLDAQEGTP